MKYILNIDKGVKHYQRLYQMGYHKYAKIMMTLLNLVHSSDIPLTCQIGDDVHFGHRGIGVVIHNDAIIEDDCLIMQNCTIGSKNDGSPHICDHCLISAGAVLLGGITIGRGAVVGANAVVLEDVASYTVVGGGTCQSIKKDTSR